MNRRTKTLIVVAMLVLALASLALGFAAGVQVGRTRGIPLVERLPDWSIGIYVGHSPLGLYATEHVDNPVLTAEHVTDVPAGFVADPFLFRKDEIWYMFFEVLNTQTNQGDIGLATSDDGMQWTYRQIVLDEPFHISYPYVFEWEGTHYMVPEAWDAGSVRLYKAVDFPTEWSFVATLLEGGHTDPSLFFHGGRWWLFTAETNDVLRLYYAEDLIGPWVEHPASPVVQGDANIARPGGRVLVTNGRIVRFAQDCEPTYGNQVRAFEIVELSTTSYRERELDENPILAASGEGWNALGMHNVDPQPLGEGRWLAAVDGQGIERVWAFGLAY
jgi:hypothetical protein